MPSESEEPQQQTKIEFGENYFEQFSVFILGGIVGALLVAITISAFSYFNQIPQSQITDEQLITQYQRGQWDTCQWINLAWFGVSAEDSAKECNEFVARTDKEDWYNLPSEGFTP